MARIDKCNGYVFVGRIRQTGSTSCEAKSKDTNKNGIEDMFQCAMQADREWGYEQSADVQERFMGTFQEEVPELKREGAHGNRDGQSRGIWFVRVMWIYALHIAYSKLMLQ